MNHARLSPRRRSARWSLAALVAGAAGAGVPFGLEGQVAVDALELRLPLDGAGRPEGTGLFRVTNTGAEGAQVTVHAEDWDRSATGENRYAPLGTLPGTCGAAVTVFPSSLRLDPGKSAQVRVSLSPDAPLDRACYTILFVETPKAAPDAAASGLSYSIRYGVKVYVEPDAPQRADITSARVLRRAMEGGPDALTVEAVYANQGVVQTFARGRAEVRRADNTSLATIPVEEFPTLPGAERNVRVDLPELAPGSYVVLMVLDYDGAEPAAAQIEVEVP